MNIIEDFTAENTAMAEALAYCRGNRWLIDADHLIAEMVRTATTDLGFKNDPDPTRAIVVMSNSMSTTDVDDSLIRARDWWYLADIDGCATGKDSLTGELISDCHRCGGSPLDLWDRRPAVSTVHVPRGRYVVEFAFCGDCTELFALLAPNVDPRR